MRPRPRTRRFLVPLQQGVPRNTGRNASPELDAVAAINATMARNNPGAVPIRTGAAVEETGRRLAEARAEVSKIAAELARRGRGVGVGQRAQPRLREMELLRRAVRKHATMVRLADEVDAGRHPLPPQDVDDEMPDAPISRPGLAGRGKRAVRGKVIGLRVPGPGRSFQKPIAEPAFAPIRMPQPMHPMAFEAARDEEMADPAARARKRKGGGKRIGASRGLRVGSEVFGPDKAAPAFAPIDFSRVMNRIRPIQADPGFEAFSEAVRRAGRPPGRVQRDVAVRKEPARKEPLGVYRTRRNLGVAAAALRRADKEAKDRAASAARRREAAAMAQEDGRAKLRRATWPAIASGMMPGYRHRFLRGRLSDPVWHEGEVRTPHRRALELARARRREDRGVREKARRSTSAGRKTRAATHAQSMERFYEAKRLEVVRERQAAERALIAATRQRLTKRRESAAETSSRLAALAAEKADRKRTGMGGMKVGWGPYAGTLQTARPIGKGMLRGRPAAVFPDHPGFPVAGQVGVDELAGLRPIPRGTSTRPTVSARRAQPEDRVKLSAVLRQAERRGLPVPAPVQSTHLMNSAGMTALPIYRAPTSRGNLPKKGKGMTKYGPYLEQPRVAGDRKRVRFPTRWPYPEASRPPREPLTVPAMRLFTEDRRREKISRNKKSVRSDVDTALIMDTQRLRPPADHYHPLNQPGFGTDMINPSGRGYNYIQGGLRDELARRQHAYYHMSLRRNQRFMDRLLRRVQADPIIMQHLQLGAAPVPTFVSAGPPPYTAKSPKARSYRKHKSHTAVPSNRVPRQVDNPFGRGQLAPSARISLSMPSSKRQRTVQARQARAAAPYPTRRVRPAPKMTLWDTLRR